MIILGAGMAGLLCGALNPNSTIYEASNEQPDNHKAVLRLRSPEIGKLVGVDMKKVKVHKAIWSKGQERQLTIGLAHQYSRKVTGKISARSIFNLDTEYRFIPPVDFVDQLRDKAPRIKYGKKIKKISKEQILFDDHKVIDRRETPIVSTVPMPVLANILVESDPAPFSTGNIYINQYNISWCDSHCTIYYPDEETSVYRATINGNVLIIEGTKPLIETEEEMVFKSLGISINDVYGSVIKDHKQKRGKITGIHSKPRQAFILKSTIDFNIYSLGRFATWRPKVMLDDVLDDIFHIRNLISKGNYAAINHPQEN